MFVRSGPITNLGRLLLFAIIKRLLTFILFIHFNFIYLGFWGFGVGVELGCGATTSTMREFAWLVWLLNLVVVPPLLLREI